MRISDIETVLVGRTPEGMLKRIEHRGSRFSALFFLALLVPMTLAMLVPFLILAVGVVAEPSAREAVVQHPASALQILGGLVLWGLLWGVPASRFFGRLGRKREIMFEGPLVRVRDTSMFGKNEWSADLAEFQGLAHHVRASLSGTRHELVLVHDDADKDLLVHVAHLITETETRDLARALGQPVVEGECLYRRLPRRTEATEGAGLLVPAAA